MLSVGPAIEKLTQCSFRKKMKMAAKDVAPSRPQGGEAGSPGRVGGLVSGCRVTTVVWKLQSDS